MPASDYLALPDPHLDPVVAAAYDDSAHEQFSPEAVGAAVEVLTELAGDGAAVEFAVGTGRLALPLAGAGVRPHGIDFSEPMLAELRRKERAELVSVTVGDMTETRVCDDAALVYLVFNTITNLRTQRQQVACFRNAAAHLAPGGRFVIENGLPKLHRLPPGETIVPFDVSEHHLGFDEYVDRVNQISISHHYHIDGDRLRTSSPAFRYVWPSELDLMAELAGMTLEARWADWHRSPFTGESQSHVSVWRKPQPTPLGIAARESPIGAAPPVFPSGPTAQEHSSDLIENDDRGGPWDFSVAGLSVLGECGEVPLRRSVPPHTGDGALPNPFSPAAFGGQSRSDNGSRRPRPQSHEQTSNHGSTQPTPMS